MNKNAFPAVLVILAILLVCAAAAFAQDLQDSGELPQTAAPAQDLPDRLPQIAVYVTGGFSENERKALGTRMLASLVNSGRYTGIERSSSFLAEIDKEQEKQRSGAIDDSQIRSLGKQFGVEFVCIADITPAFGEFQVSARIVNVETAKVEFIGDASSKLRTMDDLRYVSAEVVAKMFKKDAKSKQRLEPESGASERPAAAVPQAEPQKPKPAPKRKAENRMSVGGGLLYTNAGGGGIEWAETGEAVAMPYYGAGAYLFFDGIYAEWFAGFSSGGGKWSIDDDIEIDKGKPDMPRSYVNVGAFAKYPFSLENVKLFPLAGIDYEASLSARIKYADGTEYLFDGEDGRYTEGALSALWVKFGGGLDFEFDRTLYLRVQILYGMRSANWFEKKEAGTNGDKKITPADGLTMKAGAGIKF